MSKFVFAQKDEDMREFGLMNGVEWRVQHGAIIPGDEMQQCSNAHNNARAWFIYMQMMMFGGPPYV